MNNTPRNKTTQATDDITVAPTTAKSLEPPDVRPVRLLVVSHSDPRLTHGGGELAAHRLFRHFADEPGYEAFFLGCASSHAPYKSGTTITQPFSEAEFLYSGTQLNWFNFSNRDPEFPREFRGLIKTLKPDIVHFHHYINVGIEALLFVKEELPDCKIFVTFHEYLAICHHFGQMFTKSDNTLCYKSSYNKCTRCFPEFGQSDFFLRENYIKRFLDLAEHFFSPSAFLKKRYTDWGIPESKISVIENAVSPTMGDVSPLKISAKEPLRLGVFGQLSFLKGIDVVFDAAKILEEQECNTIIFDIYGDYRNQPEHFQEKFLARLKNVGLNVQFHGPYDQEGVDHLMQSVHALLVPSIWWENSPIVIQEALRNRRPILCSDIGGMAEKVRDGLDGIHFPVGSASALALLAKDLDNNREKLIEISSSMRKPPEIRDIIKYHAAIYREKSG